ncbi:MAG: sugar phosphate nucleotidyltransferase, partial [Bacteroidales bacterium]|nr:sugar phosphate nucleotidyltransferase [Bacteroidales bacterium]
MNQTEKSYCVILAGGKGRRLWPYSRERFPKQFVDFFGVGRTQLQQTYDRMGRIFPQDHIYINTNREYVDIVKQQLPQVTDDHIVDEPIHRNTIPSAVWAVHRILHSNCPADATVMFTPADHMIQDESTYRAEIEEGLEFVAHHDYVMALGVKPTRAEPGYGYIQLGDPMEHNIYKVQSFTEKPERDFAKMFMESGEFYWNT